MNPFTHSPSRRGFLAGAGTALAGTALPAQAQTEAQAQSPSPPGLAGRFPDFDPAYVEGAIKPFAQTSIYQGGRLAVPMIDLPFSKEAAIPPQIWGMLYDDWQPAMQEEGLSVFLQGLENRGPDNARKRIYMSALTPDLYAAHYRPKVQRALDQLFDEAQAGVPLMRAYYDGYFDLYWDLHLGVRGADIPDEVREIGTAFNTVLGFWDPREPRVYEAYMTVRALRPGLRDWIDARVQDVLDQRIDAPEATFVHYWAVNGELGENFRREDVVFECFHNFLAFSQWGNTLYNIMAVLEPESGNPAARDWFTRTMQGTPDEVDDEGGFTPLDRLVMELFRTISPNTGSVSTLADSQEGVTGTAFIIHPHPETSHDPRHWDDPAGFDPDRYRRVRTAAAVDEAACADLGFVRCPFSGAEMQVRDGRDVTLPSNGFGTVHATVEGATQPLADHAGYAPFGFGYRRCAGEWLTVDVFKDLLRHVWQEGIVFERLVEEGAEPLPVGPLAVIEDDIGFRRA
ncbi:hypothetical protein ACFQXB_08005 [Plastorhodobacter daqingensis]|uniref:Cytochrome P450 n=1 Tax=Plastorhodobacter daqingensis TaxID=1387281 RepID=A0ABW2ULJ2_9RHOB